MQSFGQAGAGLGQFNGVGGLSCDDIGTLFAIDSGNARLEMITPPLPFAVFGTSGSGVGQFVAPANVSAGTRGIYIADTGNNRIQVLCAPAQGIGAVTPRLAISNEAGLGLNQPRAVAPVSDLTTEKLFIADTGNWRVIFLELPADNPLAVWTAMTQRLSAGDIYGAIPFFADTTADGYLNAFLTLGSAVVASDTAQIPSITAVFVEDDSAEYRFARTVQGVSVTFPVEFVRENGIWKILQY